MTKTSAMTNLLLMLGTVLLASAQMSVRLLTQNEAFSTKSRVSSVTPPDSKGWFEPDVHQSFAGDGTSLGVMWVEPARYGPESGPEFGSWPRCGVSILGSKGTTQFMETVGYGWTEVLKCMALKGIGFMPGVAGSPPRILLIYATVAIHTHFDQPVVLDWSKNEAKYFENEQVSEKLQLDDKVKDIVSMKRQLKTY